MPATNSPRVSTPLISPRKGRSRLRNSCSEISKGSGPMPAYSGTAFKSRVSTAAHLLLVKIAKLLSAIQAQNQVCLRKTPV